MNNWYRLATVVVAVGIFLVGWLVFDSPDTGLYGMIVAAIGTLLPSPVSNKKTP